LNSAKINVDQNPRTSNRFSIIGVPTFIIFNSAKPIEQKVGAQSMGQLQSMIDGVICSIGY